MTLVVARRPILGLALALAVLRALRGPPPALRRNRQALHRPALLVRAHLRARASIAVLALVPAPRTARSPSLAKRSAPSPPRREGSVPGRLLRRNLLLRAPVSVHAKITRALILALARARVSVPAGALARLALARLALARLAPARLALARLARVLGRRLA